MAALIEGPDEVEVERIVLSGPAGPVDAIHARPLGMPIAGVVVHPDILGIRPLFDDLARRLAGSVPESLAALRRDQIGRAHV